MGFISLLIITVIVVMKLSWASSIATALVAIPATYVCGNKIITTMAVKKGARDDE
jgi:hypothetical protein